MIMVISAAQKRIIERVINCFETASADGKYDCITLLDDDPRGRKQVTFGRSQVTEFGQLGNLLDLYFSRGGMYTKQLIRYRLRIKDGSLAKDKAFHQLLKDSTRNDPKMRECQDYLFDQAYYIPAKKWCEANGFTEPLSLLTTYDSFIHSGKIRDDIRDDFPERVPKDGGRERVWIEQYLVARRNWLDRHKNPILHKTTYRMESLLDLVESANWDLSKKPIKAHGIIVTD